MNKPFSDSTPCPALLLIGPTGSGKTPLGARIEAHGLAGRRCLHFDFGAELRRASESDGSDMSEADRTFIRRILREGALLEPGDFPVAARRLNAFLARHRARPEDLLVLNGLPRHRDQAEAVCALIEIRAVVELRCSAEHVLARLRGNTGGDRTGRMDDDVSLVRRKLALYEERTRPLIAYYRERNVPVVTAEVTPETSTEVLWDRLSAISPVFC